MPRLSWLVKVVRNSYLCPHLARGYPVKLQHQGYMARRTTDNIYIIIYHEKSQLNGLVWGLLTLAPISRMQEEQGSPRVGLIKTMYNVMTKHTTHDSALMIDTFVSILRHLPVSISLPFPAFQYAPSLLLFSALYHI